MKTTYLTQNMTPDYVETVERMSDTKKDGWFGWYAVRGVRKSRRR